MYPTKPPNLPTLAPRPQPKLWHEILRDVGYPTDVLVLDFETFSDRDYSMKKMSTLEYVLDDRVEVLGVGLLPMSPMRSSYEHAEFSFDAACLHTVRWDRYTVVIQNAAFDALILDKHFGISPPYIIDVLALARAWNSRARNGLEHLCKRLGLPPKGETDDFAGLTFKPARWRIPTGRGSKAPVLVPRATPEQCDKLAGYCRNDLMREWECFKILLPKLSNPVVELQLMRHTLDLWLKPTLMVDQAFGQKLIVDMEAEIDRALPAGVTREDVSKNKNFERLLTEALDLAGDDVRTYMKPCKKGTMLAIAKADEALERLKKHADAGVRNLIAARVAVKSWPLHIARVNRICRMAAVNGDLLPVPLKYHGAHTGRWSGAEEINLQNLGTRGHELVNAVRGLIVAPPGHKLVIVDASQIEARVLAWIAGQWDLVEKFSNGEEIYCGFASRVLGYPVRKPNKNGDIPAIERRMGWARNSIGKVGVLGCGYGMGAAKAVGYAQGSISLEQAEKIVATYRAENSKITQFWRDIERAFCYTAKFHRPNGMARGLRFDHTPDCDVIITLPNGRELKYHHVQLEPGMRGDVIKVWNDLGKDWEYTWGGGLTENVVQAMSRDILAEAMLRCEYAGDHTALHIHDELVLVVPEDRAEDTLRWTIKELSARPSWGLECPLGAEGAIAERYGRH